MNIIAHIFLTLILVDIMNLTGLNLGLAFLFGVLVDIDHLFKIPSYLKKYGFKFVKGHHFRTFIQEPIILIVLIPLCFIFKNYVPILFFVAHLVLDYVMEYEKKPFGFLSEYTVRGFVTSFSIHEITITISLVLVYLAMKFLI